MTRKNIINVGLGLILVWLIVGVVKMNNTTNTQNIKTTGNTTTESTEEGEVEGKVWLSPANQDLEVNQNFDIEIMMDTGDKEIGAFNLSLNFDTSKINIDTTKGIDIKADTGRGFSKGPDAEEYIIMSNSEDINNGHFRLAGIGITKNTNQTEKHMVVIHAKTTDTFKNSTTEVSLKVNEFSDALGKIITTKSNAKAIITVK